MHIARDELESVVPGRSLVQIRPRGLGLAVIASPLFLKYTTGHSCLKYLNTFYNSGFIMGTKSLREGFKELTAAKARIIAHLIGDGCVYKSNHDYNIKYEMSNL